MRVSDPIAGFEDELRGIVSFLTRESLADEVRLNLQRRVVSGNLIRLESKYWINAPKANLKVPYAEQYEQYRSLGAYDVRLLDGALLQFQYEFNSRGILTRSVQRFLPSPDLTPFQEDPELYLRDEIFGEVVGRTAVGVPIRFDFDSRDGVVQAGTHPASHLTLGQYPHCRIAAAGAITPYYFVEFLLRAFYRSKTDGYTPRIPAPLVPAQPTIEEEDRRFLHIGLAPA